mgnify:CR=1 FL=1
MTSENIIRKEELQKLTDSVVRMQKDFDTVQIALKKLIDKEIQDLENEDEYWNKQKAIKGHTQQFWNKSPKSIQFNGDTYKYIDCKLIEPRGE